MRRILAFSLFLFLFFLLLFGAFIAAGIPFETSSEKLASYGGITGMILSAVLLISDVILPIPSSIIMIVNGAIYGIWIGASISMIGGIGATLFGYYIGKGGESKALKYLKKEDIAVAQRFFDNWGLLAVIVSRPVPLISETISVMAGLSGWSLQRTLLSAFIGYVPIAFIYAYSGKYALQQDFGTVSFLIVMGLGSLAWFIGRLMHRKSTKRISNSLS